MLETYREILRDVFDLPALRRAARRGPGPAHPRRARSRRGRPRRSHRRCCSTTSARSCTRATRRSPSAAPRRWRSTASCWPSCSAARSCASCSTRTPIADLELELQRLAPAVGACAPSTASHDLLRRLGDLRDRRGRRALRRRSTSAASLAELESTRRALRVRIGGRGALDRDRGRRLATATPSAQPAARRGRDVPGAGRTSRSTRCCCAGRAPTRRSPPTSRRRAGGSHARAVEERLRALVGDRRAARGRVPPGRGIEHEFTDPDVLRQLRRRSLARLRREVEPVDRRRLRRASCRRGTGSASPAGGTRPPARGRRPARGRPDPGLRPRARRAAGPRVRATRPRLLDELGAAGEVVWIGRGSLGRDDGRVALFRRDRADLLASRRASIRRAAVGADPRRASAAPPAPRRIVLPAAAGGRPRGAHRRRAARRAVGPRLVRRGHERHVRRAPRALAAALALARRAAPGARAGALGPPRAAGRWSLVADLVGEGRVADRARPRRWRPRSSSATASSPARRSRRRAIGRRLRIGLPRAPRDGGGRAAHGAATSWRASARRSSRCPARSIGCGRCATTTPARCVVLAATDPAQPYGAALPGRGRRRRAAAAAARGRRVRRDGRWRTRPCTSSAAVAAC